MRQRSRRPGRAYAAIPNAAMRDESLSIEARGLLALLMTYSDDWTFVFDHLQRVTGVGRNKLRAMLKELEAAGYIVRKVIRGEGGKLAGTEWVIVDDPCDTTSGVGSRCPQPVDGERGENTPSNRPPENRSVGDDHRPPENRSVGDDHRPPEEPTVGFLDPHKKNNSFKKTNGGGGSAREAADASFREGLLEAMGVGPEGITGPSKFIGGAADMAEAARWLALPGLTPDAICAEIRAVMGGKRDGPPSSFRYFTSAMQRLSAALIAAPLQPASLEDTAHERPASRDRRASAADDAFAERIAFAARNRSPSRPDFGFG